MQPSSLIFLDWISIEFFVFPSIQSSTQLNSFRLFSSSFSQLLTFLLFKFPILILSSSAPRGTLFCLCALPCTPPLVFIYPSIHIEARIDRGLGPGLKAVVFPKQSFYC